MEQYQPVDGDPFTGASLQPVNGDPFAEATGGVSMSQGDYASAGQKLGSALSQTWPARMAVGAYDAMMAPGDYMQGKISTEEAERQAFNAAGLVMSGGVLSGVERAAGEAILGSGPIRAYHSTPNVFSEFDSSKIGSATDSGHLGRGFYFSTDPKVVQEGANKVTADLNVNNPLNVSLPDFRTDKQTVVREALGLPRDAKPQDINEALMAKGHDGVVLDYSPTGYNHKEIMVPNAGQIKTLKTVPVEGDPFQPITAYHGSPHDFDAFDMSKIGTGEGAQAYGHGLYFAGNEGVAESYKTALSQQAYPVWKDAGGKAVDIDTLARSAKGDPQSLAASFLQQEPDVDSALGFAQKLHPDAFGGQAEKDATIQGLQGFKDAGLTKQPPGKMYQVSINANPDHFLDWDKPLSEQHPVVQDLARNADLSHLKPGNRTRRQIEMWREGVPMNSLEEPSGHVLYNALTDYGTDTASNAALTEKLQQAGIPGIKYLDAGSRGSGTGTSNYVVFNHDIIDIIKKYGIGGLGIGTAAGIKHFQTQPVNNDPYSNQNPGGVI